MLNNLYLPMERKAKIEFIPHSLGKMKGDLSRKEIYCDRLILQEDFGNNNNKPTKTI